MQVISYFVRQATAFVGLLENVIGHPTILLSRSGGRVRCFTHRHCGGGLLAIYKIRSRLGTSGQKPHHKNTSHNIFQSIQLLFKCTLNHIQVILDNFIGKLTYIMTVHLQKFYIIFR